MGQPGLVSECQDLWLDRKLAAADSVFSLQSGDGRSGFACSRRHPERTILYRALAHHFEHFLRVYEERFLYTHGYLRGCVEPAVHRYLDCGIFDQGVARVRCPDCRHEFLVAFSCKLRGLCPSCHQKRELSPFPSGSEFSSAMTASCWENWPAVPGGR